MLQRRFSLAFLVVTLFIASSDALLVWINYQSAREALRQGLVDRGRQLQDSYRMSLEQVGSFMRQTASYIANDEHVNRLFLAGRRAVEEEGGGPGGPRAEALRRELMSHVADGWEEMTRHYKGRQLHFHLPPDVSFLRVHRPGKFGDDLSAVRHSIVAVNIRQESTMGFESGRVYAGIRGVVPVFAEDDDGRRVHVGALEAGTSFSLMLEQLKGAMSAEFAVLMTLDHARETMWPSFLQEYLKTHPEVAGHMLEAGTSPEQAKRLLADPKVIGLLGRKETVLTRLGGEPVAVTGFGLRDYLGSVDPMRPDIGTILVWTPAGAEVEAFEQSLRTNLVIAALGFVLIEILIFWAMRSESRLRVTTAMALTDGLTGVANRRRFEEQLPQEVARARRRHDFLSLLLCDIDYFKQYNDRYGHQRGDDCLLRVAQAMDGVLKRAGEFVARYGGEEFVVVLPSVDAEEALRVAERLRRAVEALAIEHRGSAVAARVTISCGVAGVRYDPARREEGGALLRAADEALYRAKAEGRNRVVVAAS